MKEIKELIDGYSVRWLAKKIGVNEQTLYAQLNAGNPRKLTLENELKIRQLLTK